MPLYFLSSTSGETVTEMVTVKPFPFFENRNAIPDAEAEAMGNYIYGCDRCQLICPHNRFAQATDIEEFSPSEEFLKMTPDDWKQLTEEDYRRLFKGSAVKRAKYAGLKRNIDAALSND